MDDQPLDIDWAEIGACANFSLDDLRDNDLNNFSLMFDMIMEDRPVPLGPDLDAMPEPVAALTRGRKSVVSESSKLELDVAPASSLERDSACAEIPLAKIPASSQLDSVFMRETATVSQTSFVYPGEEDTSQDQQASAPLLHTLSFPGSQACEEELPSRTKMVAVSQLVGGTVDGEVLSSTDRSDMATVESNILHNFTMESGASCSSMLGGDRTQTTKLEGIEAADMKSLLEQFEDASSWQGSEDTELHQLLDGGKFKSHSVPSSRVCSTANSPANSPPSTPPPMLLSKIRNHQKNSMKRKTAMLPMGEPVKRSRGKASSQQPCWPTGGSSRLRRVLSRQRTSTGVKPEKESGPWLLSQAVSQQNNMTILLPAQSQAVSVLSAQPATNGDSISCQLPSSSVGGVSVSHMKSASSSGTTDQECGGAQPQILPVVRAVPAFSNSLMSSCQEVGATRSKVALLSQSGAAASGGLTAVTVAHLQNAGLQGQGMLTHSPGSRLKQNNLLATTSTKPCFTTTRVTQKPILPSTVTGSETALTMKNSATLARFLASVQSTATSLQVSPTTAANTGTAEQQIDGDETHTVILIRGEDRLPATHQASILDHDYAVGCPQRIDTDIRELDSSPTKKCSHKPLHTGQSIPVCSGNRNSKSQSADFNYGNIVDKYDTTSGDGENNHLSQHSTVITGSDTAAPVNITAKSQISSSSVDSKKMCSGSPIGCGEGKSSISVFQAKRSDSENVPRADSSQTSVSFKNQWQQLKEIVQNITQLTNNHSLNKTVTMKAIAVSSQNSLLGTTTQVATTVVSQGIGQVANRPVQQVLTPVLSAATAKKPELDQACMAGLPVCQHSAVRQQVKTVSPVVLSSTQQYPPVQPPLICGGVSHLSMRSNSSSNPASGLPSLTQPPLLTSSSVSSSSAVRQPALTLTQSFPGSSSSLCDTVSVSSKKASLVLPQTSNSPTFLEQDKTGTSSSVFDTDSVSSKEASFALAQPSLTPTLSLQARVKNDNHLDTNDGNQAQDNAGRASDNGSQQGLQSAEEQRTTARSHGAIVYNKNTPAEAGSQDTSGQPAARTNSLSNDVLYSMPVSDFEFSSTDVLKSVAPAEQNSQHDFCMFEQVSSSEPACDNSDETKVDPAVAPTEDMSLSGSVTSPSASPHSPYDSHDADFAFRPKFDHGEEFATLWEECKTARLAQITQSTGSTNQAVESSSSNHITESVWSDHSGTTLLDKEGSSSDLSVQPKSFSCGTEDKSGNSTGTSDDFFSKIPSYLNEISIQQNTGRKQLKVDDIEKGLSASDHLPPDHSAAPSKQGEAVLDKIPSYFKCFTDSQQYDSMETMAAFSLSSESEKQPHYMKGNKISSSSDAQSLPQSTSPAKSWGRKGSRGRKGSKEQRRSYTGAVNACSQSGSGAGHDRDRQCRSPTVCGSNHSSLKSRSRSSSPSSLPNNIGQSRSRSRSRSSERRYASTSLSGRQGGCREADSQSGGRRRDGLRKTEERKIVYVGKIPDRFTKRQLYDRFRRFGVIESASVHFREAGDNYGFVTFRRTEDAYRAIENGNNIASELHFDLCFGGRRQFCGNDYADLDGNRVIEEEYNPGPAQKESFDQLLRQYYRCQR